MYKIRLFTSLGELIASSYAKDTCEMARIAIAKFSKNPKLASAIVNDALIYAPWSKKPYNFSIENLQQAMVNI